MGKLEDWIFLNYSDGSLKSMPNKITSTDGHVLILANIKTNKATVFSLRGSFIEAWGLKICLCWSLLEIWPTFRNTCHLYNWFEEPLGIHPQYQTNWWQTASGNHRRIERMCCLWQISPRNSSAAQGIHAGWRIDKERRCLRRLNGRAKIGCNKFSRRIQA